MRKALLFIVLFNGLLFSLEIYGQTGWQWVKRPFTPAIESGLCAIDKWGNVYGGGMVPNLITKYDTSGNYSWSHTFPGSFGITITCDVYGNLYELGAYTSTSINIGAHTLYNTHHPYNQFFIVKLDSTGSIKWSNNIGSVVAMGGFDYYKGIATDILGNLFVTCPFSNNPTIGSYTFTNHDPTDSSNDIMIAKMDSSGSVIWAKSYGGFKNDVPIAIVTTNSNNLYFLGQFSSDSLILGSTILTDTSSYLYNSNIFISKLNNIGDPQWAKKGGGTSSNVIATGMVADFNEDPILTGYYENGSLSFDTFTFADIGTWVSAFGFLVKYDSIGNVKWIKETKSCGPRSIGIDLCDNIWMVGWMDYGNDTVDGHIISSPIIKNDPLFIAGWSTSGSYIESGTLGSGSDDLVEVALDCRGNAYICGDYNIDTFYVGPDTLFGGTGGGQEYMFIARYNTGTNCNKCVDDAGALLQKDPKQNTTITLYPNPATNECTINYTGTLSKNASIAIYDITGRLMHTYPLTPGNTIISTADLTPGMYQCRIDVDGTGVVDKKMVVIK